MPRRKHKGRKLPLRLVHGPMLLGPARGPVLPRNLSDVLKGTHGHTQMREMQRSAAGTQNRRWSSVPWTRHFQTTDKAFLWSLSPLGCHRTLEKINSIIKIKWQIWAQNPSFHIPDQHLQTLQHQEPHSQRPPLPPSISKASPWGPLGREELSV